jgi:glycosyltransferase involved in cell wall biosynthesis
MIKIAIDATRARSGGAIAHIIGIINELDVNQFEIEEIHIWSYKKLLNQLPDRLWLIKHSSPLLEKSLLYQLYFQAFNLENLVKKKECDVLFTLDAASLCRFSPMVTLSQDLLSYEPGILSNLKFGFDKIRLTLILFLQNRTFRRSEGVIFLTEYAQKLITESTGKLTKSTVIPHGVNPIFKYIKNRRTFPAINNKIKCLYISPNFEYKYQINVAKAIFNLYEKGYNIEISFIGEGSIVWSDLLNNVIKHLDPEAVTLKNLGQINNKLLPDYIAKSDIFIFASGCEAFGITLLEAMCTGIPIACSNLSSLPETLKDGGVYFNPKSVFEIESAIESIVNDEFLRHNISSKAFTLSTKYSWETCSYNTFKFITNTLKRST